LDPEVQILVEQTLHLLDQIVGPPAYPADPFPACQVVVQNLEHLLLLGPNRLKLPVLRMLQIPAFLLLAV
tara:strand:+ start:938 stop:1147 length:210 start_codon:yes stop_codon:yes gene_type:complete